MEAGPWKIFENTLAERLREELATAEKWGVKPTHVDDPGFGNVANEGAINWAVTENGDLLFAPRSVRGEAIAHTVLTQGGPVVAAGEAYIAVDRNERFCTEITNQSGHYLPDRESLEIGKKAFKVSGITFLGDDGGNSDAEGGGRGGNDGGNGDGHHGGHDGHNNRSDGDSGSDSGSDAAAQKARAERLEKLSKDAHDLINQLSNPIDESEATFKPHERRIAEKLQSEGKRVKALPEGNCSDLTSLINSSYDRRRSPPTAEGKPGTA
jgi:hypothetical protein